ncbi:MAG: ribonuclease P protein component [Deltaproteobacteria bacterium]|nr:ribonuclease P protein component [Deltaproteobacteria bacterium]
MIDEAPRGATGSQRFRRADRIRSSRDYARIRRVGRRYGAESVSLEVVPRELGPRLGLVVGKRIGNAVERTRVKRAVREWFRLRRSAFAHSADIVVVARPGAASRTTTELWHELDATIARAQR